MLAQKRVVEPIFYQTSLRQFTKTFLCATMLALAPYVSGAWLTLSGSTMTTNVEDEATANLKIEARLGKKSFVVGERVQLVLWITNQGKELVTVADPRRGGDSLQIWLKLPDGEECSFTTGEALRAPGVKQVLVGMRLPPGVRQNFEFDLAKLTSLNEPGRYQLRLHYTWKAGEQAWHSPEMPFSITAARRQRAHPLAKDTF